MDQTTKAPRIAPVHKTLTVKLAPERAFRLFTAEIGTWWPLATHSVGMASADAAVLEGRIGGRLYERQRDGNTATWGHVRLWDPPHRLVFSWHPGRSEDAAQEVELRFAAEGAGTRVELEHRGWEILGNEAGKKRDDYDKGWAFVFGECFGKAAGVR